MKWSSEVAEDKNGNVVVFNYASGKLPSYPPTKHRILYKEELEQIDDKRIRLEVEMHRVVSYSLLG